MSTDPNPSNSRVRVSSTLEMEQDSSSIWDWDNLLDFSLDDDADPLILPWDLPSSPPLAPSPHPPPPQTEKEPTAAAATGSSSSKVRKRDPRLVCENFLAGRVPCACPEVDEMMLREEEEAAGGRKRVRAKDGAAGTAAAVVRCQVLGCEADIRELKGYHRRHRVCLRCASASSVVISGEDRRYCQQCGKFHVLQDFDEGKRSCRRKLERHNRRRRRPADVASVTEKKNRSRADLSAEATFDEEPKEENGFGCETVLSSKVNDREISLESDNGHGSPICSLPSSQNMQSNSIMSFPVPSEAHIDEEKDNSKPAISSAICDNRSAYSTVCPTGRISFKLYDWNPAEFPRRLRHQIFQWLASMPVELEGYVRPGCTILTIFIAMPQFMWEKLSQDAAVYIKDLIHAPESLLLGRGKIFIFLNNLIIHVLKDGSSLMNIKMEVKAPRIHYVYPTYFEAGKPMEFVVCGSNLNQPKFRFLVSFAGKYMAYDSCCAISHGKILLCDGNENLFCHESDHELLRIRISRTDAKLFGPAFIEVENESGISNFIPILIGNKYICSELDRMQVLLSGYVVDSLKSQTAISGASPSFCELFVAKQTALSELLVDIAWLLKEPCIDRSEAIFNSINLQRLTCLLKFSVQNELVNVLEVILNYFDVKFGTMGTQDSDYSIPVADLELLQGYVNSAKQILNQRALHDVRSELDESSSQRGIMLQSYAMSANNQDVEARNTDCTCSTAASAPGESDENSPLVGTSMAHRKHCYPQLRVDWPRKSWAHSFPRSVTGTRLAVFVTVSVVMCLGACIVLLHPIKPGEIAGSIRRCLFGYPFP